jgi:hypothetical protein
MLRTDAGVLTPCAWTARLCIVLGAPGSLAFMLERAYAMCPARVAAHVTGPALTMATAMGWGWCLPLPGARGGCATRQMALGRNARGMGDAPFPT